MLKSKIKYLMADNDINSLSKIISDTGLSRNTLNKLYKSENLETLGLSVIITLCKYFKCQINDIIEYIPED